ncbi:NUDIX domain-containing protein [Paenibacillus sp. sgz500958]|uniref:NUDIX hydrolase n=1 Tax=Paenibacillus sp. sgz500958 TaxID=3242475 RepID=UPI0036D211C0
MAELVNKDGLTEAEFMSQYRAGDYERPSLATDMAVFTVSSEEEVNYRKLPEKSLKLLMIRRGDHPFIGQWALAGGFVRPGETTEETAARELAEETGAGNVYLEQLYTFSDPGRDPRTWVISCAYLALVDSSSLSLEAGDDAAEVAWFQVDYKLQRESREMLPGGFVKESFWQLTLSFQDIRLEAEIVRKQTVSERTVQTEYIVASSKGIAFDHAKIIAYAIERLRGKVEYTGIAFNLMPSLFTLTELQQVYEIILDTEMLKANFRRKIAGLVMETDQYARHAGHRPSKLFKRNMEGMI